EGDVFYDGPITDGDHIVNKQYIDQAVAGEKTHFYSVNSTDAGAGNYDNDGATGVDALAAGVGAEASEQNATAVGYNSTASGVDAAALGTSASAIGTAATALGRETVAAGIGDVAIGFQADTTTPNAPL